MTNVGPESFEKSPLADDLFAQFYDELRKTATFYRKSERGTLEFKRAALVNLAFARFKARAPLDIPDRTRFLAFALRRIRPLLADDARKKGADRERGGPIRKSPHDDVDGLLRLHDSTLGWVLDSLAKRDPLWVDTLDLRFIMQLPVEDVARGLDVSPKVVRDVTRLAMARLRSLM